MLFQESEYRTVSTMVRQLRVPLNSHRKMFCQVLRPILPSTMGMVSWNMIHFILRHPPFALPGNYLIVLQYFLTSLKSEL